MDEQCQLQPDEQVNRNEFGNIIVMSDKHFHMSIGPHYKQFILGFIMLLLYQLGLMTLSLTQTAGERHKKFGATFCVLAPLFYLLTALRDPGLYRPLQCHQAKPRFCHSCQHFMTSAIKHCSHCNICVEGYDHHCRWISKCIGKNNLHSFYAFIGSLMVLNSYLYYVIYCIFWAHE